MPGKKIIAVAGATGAQGGGLVRAIVGDPKSEFTARALTRDANSEKAKALKKLGARDRAILELLYGCGVRVAEAQKQEALLAYKKSIQQSFQEVSDALVGVRMLKEVRIESGKQVKALSQQTDLAYQRYFGGMTPYLEVLDSDRQLFESELKLTQDRANELLAVIALYRALGGGWQNGSEPAGSQNQNTPGMNREAVK